MILHRLITKNKAERLRFTTKIPKGFSRSGRGENMKSFKIKLTTLVLGIAIIVSMMVVGVIAATNVSVNLGGSISFVADNVYARITGVIENASIGSQTLPTLEFSATNENPDQSSWSNLSLEFDEEATPIEFTIEVENLARDRALTLNLIDTTTSENENLKKSLSRDDGSYSSGNNITLQASSGDGTSVTTFVVTFEVEDKNSSFNSAAFDYVLNLYNGSEAPQIYEDYTFSIDENAKTATLTKYSGSETSLVVPNTISIDQRGQYISGSDYRVTAIADASSTETSVFYDVKSTLSSVTLPANLQRIGDYAFYECSALTSITVPTSVTSIGTRALQYCTALKSINIPQNSNLQTIEERAFANCSSLDEELVLPSKLVSIGESAFVNCTSLPNIDFDNATSLQSIGLGAFAYCNGLVNLDLSGSSLETADEGAFQSCANLESFTLPSTMATIGRLVFYGCNELADVIIEGPSNLSSIGYGAFYQCASLANVDLSNCTNLTLIDQFAFRECPSLTSISVKNNTNNFSIAGLAFYSSGLTSADFSGCTNLSLGETAFAQSSLVSANFSGCTNLSLSNATFDYCTSLTTVNFSNCSNMTTLTDWTFEGCSSLANVDFTNCTSLETLGYASFNGCSMLTSLDFSDCNLKVIGESAFTECPRLQSVILPKSLTTISAHAFDGASALQTIDLSNCANLTILGNASFQNCTSLTTVNLNGCENLATLDDYAFFGCTSLNSVTFETCSALESIGYATFYSTRLTTIDFTDCSNLKYIGYAAFYLCDTLTSVDFASGVARVWEVSQTEDFATFQRFEAAEAETYALLLKGTYAGYYWRRPLDMQ